jgi:hypothetical protein
MTVTLSCDHRTVDGAVPPRPARAPPHAAPRAPRPAPRAPAARQAPRVMRRARGQVGATFLQTLKGFLQEP